MNKRGDTRQVLWWVINLFFLAVILFAMLNIIISIRKNFAFERRFMAKDIGLLTNTLYASPNNILYVYPETDFPFNIEFEQNKVIITDTFEGDLTAAEYYFVEDENIDFVYKKIMPNIFKDATGDEKALITLGLQKSSAKIKPFSIVKTSDVLE